MALDQLLKADYAEASKVTTVEAEKLGTALKKKAEWKNTLQSSVDKNLDETDKKNITTASESFLKTRYATAESLETAYKKSDKTLFAQLSLLSLMKGEKGYKESADKIYAGLKNQLYLKETPTNAPAIEEPKPTIGGADAIDIPTEKKVAIKNIETTGADGKTNVKFDGTENQVSVSKGTSPVETKYVEKDGNMYKITEGTDPKKTVTLAYDADATSDLKQNKETKEKFYTHEIQGSDDIKRKCKETSKIGSECIYTSIDGVYTKNETGLKTTETRTRDFPTINGIKEIKSHVSEGDTITMTDKNDVIWTKKGAAITGAKTTGDKTDLYNTTDTTKPYALLDTKANTYTELGKTDLDKVKGGTVTGATKYDIIYTGDKADASKIKNLHFFAEGKALLDRKITKEGYIDITKDGTKTNEDIYTKSGTVLTLTNKAESETIKGKTVKKTFQFKDGKKEDTASSTDTVETLAGKTITTTETSTNKDRKISIANNTDTSSMITINTQGIPSIEKGKTAKGCSIVYGELLRTGYITTDQFISALGSIDLKKTENLLIYIAMISAAESSTKSDIQEVAIKSIKTDLVKIKSTFESDKGKIAKEIVDNLPVGYIAKNILSDKTNDGTGGLSDKIIDGYAKSQQANNTHKSIVERRAAYLGGLGINSDAVVEGLSDYALTEINDRVAKDRDFVQDNGSTRIANKLYKAEERNKATSWYGASGTTPPTNNFN